VFTARYGLISYITRISLVHKGLITLTLREISVHRNAHKFQNNIYQPEKGVAMGSPISGNMAEIFLQHIERKLHLDGFYMIRITKVHGPMNIKCASKSF